MYSITLLEVRSLKSVSLAEFKVWGASSSFWWLHMFYAMWPLHSSLCLKLMDGQVRSYK